MSTASRGGALVVAVCSLLAVGIPGWLVLGSAGDAARPAPSAAAPPASARAPAPRPSARAPSASRQVPARPGRPLAGKVVVLDPGHNPNNQYHPDAINALVDIGTGRKECDTTGTSTDSGYAEASFTLDVVRRARALLSTEGTTVRLTYDGDRPFGPCVDERARIGNAAHADAAVSVHADGAAADGRGFHVIVPAAVHQGIADTTAIAGPSRRLGLALRGHFATDTGTGYATYVAGGTGLAVRGDLGGLNLSAVPKVFIECGNMRNAQDAGLLTDAGWRQRAAQGISDGITAYLEGKN